MQKKHLEKMVHAYNCRHCVVTGFSPFFLLHGHSRHLPIELLFNLQPTQGNEDCAEYMKNWQASMREAYEIATRRADRETSRSKQEYDRKIHGAHLQSGGTVLVRNLLERGGPGKL